MNARRLGYTLIELLVVISIIAVLAAITVAFLPSVAGNATEARAGVLVQGWLNVAKQRALRDQAPRGVRLWATSTNIGGVALSPVCTECQYIEQPDDFNNGIIVSNAAGTSIGFSAMTNDLYNGYPGNISDMKYWNVQPGDSLEVLGSGLMHVIQTVPAGNVVTIYPPLPSPIAVPTPNYRIVRVPRPVGDEMLKMPDGTVVDLATNFNFGSPLPLVYEPGNPSPVAVDVLFGPSGAVISRSMASGNINLWVRTPDAGNPADPFRGSPTIISVFVRTGFVGAYPPSWQGSPYALVY
jgi:prepilin-type N-terminal cleavage/methylation domain-containing protein